jgi:uncharacterized protein RhaS with RHS repeats
MKVIHLDAPQTWNLYAYVANNPTTLADPSGLDPVNQGSDLNYYDSDERRAEEDKLKQKNLVRSINVLGHEVAVKYADGLTDDQMKAAGDKLVAAAGVINGAADKLTAAEKASIGNIKTIDVDPTASRSSVDVRTGTVHYNAGQLAEPTARLGSDIAHDSFHITQWKSGLPYSGGPAERNATNFQIPVARKLGLDQANIDILQHYADHIEDFKGYWNSSVTHPP